LAFSQSRQSLGFENTENMVWVIFLPLFKGNSLFISYLTSLNFFYYLHKIGIIRAFVKLKQEKVCKMLCSFAHSRCSAKVSHLPSNVFSSL
jgi:hypothetical protein